jgi:hypothetical protein
MGEGCTELALVLVLHREGLHPLMGRKQGKVESRYHLQMETGTSTRPRDGQGEGRRSIKNG